MVGPVDRVPGTLCQREEYMDDLMHVKRQIKWREGHLRKLHYLQTKRPCDEGIRQAIIDDELILDGLKHKFEKGMSEFMDGYSF